MIDFKKKFISSAAFFCLFPSLFSFTTSNRHPIIPIKQDLNSPIAFDDSTICYFYDPHPQSGVFYASTFHYKFYIIEDVTNIELDIECQNMSCIYEKTPIAYDFTFMFDKEGKAEITISFSNKVNPNIHPNDISIQFFKAKDRVYYCTSVSNAWWKEIEKEEWKRNKATEIQNEAYKAMPPEPDDWAGNYWIGERLDQIPNLYTCLAIITKPYGYSDQFYMMSEIYDRYHQKCQYPTYYIIMDNDGDVFIHSMKIVDPAASFYGLSIQSSLLDIQSVFKDMSGFTLTIPQFKTGLRAIATYEGKIDFLFFEDSISIQMPKDLPDVIVTDEDYENYLQSQE